MLFGVLALVLIATAGAVVDFTRIEQARTRAQNLLDSAALGMQPRILDGATEEAIETDAGKFLAEGLGTEIASTMTDVTIVKEEGQLILQAQITVPTYFVSLVGIPSVKANVFAEATRKQLGIELAMVLDNSGSMAWYNRMNELEEAAECAVNVLLNGDCDSTALLSTVKSVKIGIVPFTEFVNIGTGYQSSWWMDSAGNSPLADDNFDDDSNDTTPMTTKVKRFDLFTAVNKSWEGCVEARTAPMDTDDTTPDAANPSTLFVPQFAVDQPDWWWNNNYIQDKPSVCPREPKWTFTQTKTKCSTTGWNATTHNASCGGSSVLTNTITQIDQNGTTTTSTNSTATSTPVATNPASIYSNPASCTDNWTSSGSGNNNKTNTYTRTCDYYYSERELQERICKYSGDNYWGSQGPNNDCPNAPILTLTNDKANLLDRIEDMSANGGTNIQQGTIWGFHMLSPTEPLTDGVAYTEPTHKVMIVMTDGENTNPYSSNMNGAEWYLPWGYPYNGRLTGASTDALQTEMDTRTKAACANAKAKGITIYTIGLGTTLTSNPTKVQNMLKDCSSGDGYWKFPSDTDDLSAVFEEIAGQLAELRLAQ